MKDISTDQEQLIEVYHSTTQHDTTQQNMT